MTIELQNVTIGSLKRYYRSLEFFFLKLDFEKVEFQKNSISLISLGNQTKCWIVFLKRTKANFVLPFTFQPKLYFHKYTYYQFHLELSINLSHVFDKILKFKESRKSKAVEQSSLLYMEIGLRDVVFEGDTAGVKQAISNGGLACWCLVL